MSLEPAKQQPTPSIILISVTRATTIVSILSSRARILPLKSDRVARQALGRGLVQKRRLLIEDGIRRCDRRVSTEIKWMLGVGTHVNSQFHRAVDIVQRSVFLPIVSYTLQEPVLTAVVYPRGVQCKRLMKRNCGSTRYTSKVRPLLADCSHDTQTLTATATEGDISAARPGLLDMLGRAKWDSWNKQKGTDKEDAKTQYVAALIRVSREIHLECHDFTADWIRSCANSPRATLREDISLNWNLTSLMVS